MLPIYDHREIVGYAKTINQAKRILKNKLQTIPKGWVINVWERNTEIVDLPKGFVYSVSPK